MKWNILRKNWGNNLKTTLAKRNFSILIKIIKANRNNYRKLK